MILDELISVVVGAPSLARQLPVGTVLVIDSRADRLDSLRGGGGALNQDLACVEAVLAEQADELLLWHCYSDSRLDGVLAAEHWKALYPNVTELEQRPLAGQRLEVILDRWEGLCEPVGPSAQVFQLMVRQGSPLAALVGLGPFEPRLKRVVLAIPGAQELWGSDVEAWLLARGFAAVPDQPLTWERDPLASCRLECEALALERDGLQQRVGELENRLAQINRELEEIIALLDSAASPDLADVEVPA